MHIKINEVWQSQINVTAGHIELWLTSHDYKQVPHPTEECIGFLCVWVCVGSCVCVSYFTTLCIRMKLGFVVGGGQCMSPVVSLGVDWEWYMTGFVSWSGPDWSLHLQPPSDNLQHISKWQQLGWHGDRLAWIHRATPWEKHKREREKGQRETRAWKIRETASLFFVFLSLMIFQSQHFERKKLVLFGKNYIRAAPTSWCRTLCCNKWATGLEGGERRLKEQYIRKIIILVHAHLSNCTFRKILDWYRGKKDGWLACFKQQLSFFFFNHVAEYLTSLYQFSAWMWAPYDQESQLYVYPKIMAKSVPCFLWHQPCCSYTGQRGTNSGSGFSLCFQPILRCLNTI